MSHRWDCLDFVYLLVAHRNTQFADPKSSVSSVTDLHHKVSFSLQRVCCTEIKASCSRKSEKQHSKQGWSSKPTALLPRAPERAAQKHPSPETTSGSHLLSLGLCTRAIHFIPWAMKGSAGQGAKKLGSAWWDFLKKQNSYLHSFGKSQRGNRRLRAASCQPKVAVQHLSETQRLLAAVRGLESNLCSQHLSPSQACVVPWMQS